MSISKKNIIQAKRLLKEKFVETTDMPKEVALNLPKMTLIGNTDLHIENIKGVIEYTDDLVRINSTVGIIKLTGSAFKIMDISSEEVFVYGRIKCIEIMQ